MKFPFEGNHWSQHVAEPAKGPSTATWGEGETRSSRANGADRPILVRGVPPLPCSSFTSDSREMKQKIDRRLDPVSAVAAMLQGIPVKR